jgi:hypothetical protein
MPRKGMVVACVALAWLTLGVAHAGGDRPGAPQAQEALRQAEQAVRQAWEQRALWTTAQEALEQARAAVASGDYAGAVRSAQSAIEQAQLGMAQSRYPRFTE